MKLITKEVRIALVAIMGAVVLFFGMNFLKGLNLFSSTDDYLIEFDDISGLASSSPIYAGGFQVGTVRGIEYDYTNAKPTKVIAALSKNMRVPVGSTARIESDMLGNVKINLIVGKDIEHTLKPGDVIQGGMDSGTLGQISAMLPAVEKMLPKLDSIMASLSALLADPAIAQSLHNIRTMTANLTTTTKELNTLMNSLNGNVPTLMTKANNVLDNTEKLTSNLAAVDIENTMKQVDQTLANVEAVTARLNSNDGSLGLLMNDASLYNNLNATVSHADTLLINLREHPKRYVHFSLFGKKDK